MLSAKFASLGRLRPFQVTSRSKAPTSAPSNAPRAALRQTSSPFLIRSATALNRFSFPSLGQNWNRTSNIHRSTLITSRHYSTESQEQKQVDPQQELRSHLKTFLMRVHPDFFSKHPKVQEENDRSLKQLNSLLDMAEEYSKKAAGPILLDRTRVPARYSTTFFLRQGPKTLAETKAEEKRKENEPKGPTDAKLFPPTPGSEYPSIVATYTVPETYFTNPFSREFLERDIRLFLNDLLKQAGLPTLTIEKTADEGRYSTTSEEIVEQFEDDGTYKPRENYNHRRDAQSLRKEFKNVLASFLDRHYPTAQLAVDKLGHDWELYVGHKPEALIALGIADLHHSSERERKQIHYQPQLDGEERAQGLILVEELWNSGVIPHDIPVYITRDENAFLTPESLPGFITIPLSFENEKFQEYLRQNLKTIMVSRYNMRGQMLEVEYAIRNFTKTFKLARIDSKTTLEHTAVAIAAINEAREQLLAKFKPELEGMAWNIVEARSIAEFNKSGDSASYVRPDGSSSTSEPVDPKSGPKVWSPAKPEGSGYELEDVADSALKRRKLDLSPEYLAKMAEIRAKNMEKAKQKAFSDDWDDDDAEEEVTAAAMDELSEIEKDIEKEWRKSKKDVIGADKNESEQLSESQAANEANEPIDEFEEAMIEEQRKQAQRVNRELVYTEGTPVYSLRKDLLLIPWNTSSESLLSWMESNKAMLHFRQKLYPSKEWRTKMRTVCKAIGLVLGVTSVAFYGRTIWDKTVQVVALRNLEANAQLIRNANLKNFKLVITQNSIGINLSKRTLKLPYNITPKLWAAFLRDLSTELNKPKVAGAKRFNGKTIHL